MRRKFAPFPEKTCSIDNLKLENIAAKLTLPYSAPVERLPKKTAKSSIVLFLGNDVLVASCDATFDKKRQMFNGP